jgi:hypothetical protein
VRYEYVLVMMLSVGFCFHVRCAKCNLEEDIHLSADASNENVFLSLVISFLAPEEIGFLQKNKTRL